MIACGKNECQSLDEIHMHYLLGEEIFVVVDWKIFRDLSLLISEWLRWLQPNSPFSSEWSKLRSESTRQTRSPKCRAFKWETDRDSLDWTAATFSQMIPTCKLNSCKFDFNAINFSTGDGCFLTGYVEPLDKQAKLDYSDYPHCVWKNGPRDWMSSCWINY